MTDPQLITQSMMSQVVGQAFKPWTAVQQPFQLWKRYTAYKLGRAFESDSGKSHPPSQEENFLELVRLLTGADFRMARFSPDEAVQRFAFQGGIRPTSGQVYFQHPFRSDRYLFPSSTNLTLAREKVIAFHDIAANLGAKTITLISGQVTSKTWRGKAAVPLPDAAAQVGINAAFEEGSATSTQIYSEFDAPDSPPAVPDYLKMWAKSDAMFESLERTRLTTNVRRHKAILELSERAHFNAKVVGVYDNIGLDIGGEYQKLFQSIWHFDIEFWPKAKT